MSTLGLTDAWDWRRAVRALGLMAFAKALGLTKSQHAAVGALVRRFQDGGNLDAEEPYAPPSGYCIPAKVTTALTAATAGQAGAGEVTLYGMSESGALTLGSTVLKCWNLGAAVALNRQILVSVGTRGVWAVVDACT